MQAAWRLGILGAVALALSGCTSLAIPGSSQIVLSPSPAVTVTSVVQRVEEPPARSGSAHLDGLIAKYADLYNVPESLIRRIIVRESRYNPKARNGPYWGLMQIRYDTAQSMGYRGPASGLLDPDINLRYGVKYLAGAYLVADANSDQAVRNYASGYYYRAKQKGLLAEVGLD